MKHALKIIETDDEVYTLPRSNFIKKVSKELGIETKVINEAYTSKASYLDHDEFVNGDFSGNRIKRGLYESKKGTLINADQNASLNMIRKGNPNALWIGNKGVNTPKRTYLFGV